MHVPQPVAETVKKVARDRHVWSNRPSVGDVETETSLGQFCEGNRKLVPCATPSLTGVHVLEQKRSPQSPISTRVLDRVWVHDDSGGPSGELVQLGDELVLIHLPILRGTMNAQV